MLPVEMIIIQQKGEVFTDLNIWTKSYCGCLGIFHKYLNGKPLKDQRKHYKLKYWRKFTKKNSFNDKCISVMCKLLVQCHSLHPQQELQFSLLQLEGIQIYFKFGRRVSKRITRISFVSLLRFIISSIPRKLFRSAIPLPQFGSTYRSMDVNVFC